MNSIKAFFRFLISKLFLINLVAAILVGILIFWYIMNRLDKVTNHDESTHISLPSMYNTPTNEAVSELEKLGFNVKIDSVYIDNLEAGTVFNQDPLPSDTTGHKYKPGRNVSLKVISVTPPSVTVEDVYGKSKRLAESKLTSVGFKVRVKFRPHEQDFVLGVEHKGKELEKGAKLPRGTKIDLIVGKGSAKPVTVPVLNGLTINQAKTRLGSAALSLHQAGCEECITTEDSTNAVIIRQEPAGGQNSSASAGSEIMIWLGKKAPQEAEPLFE